MDIARLIMHEEAMNITWWIEPAAATQFSSTI